MFSRRRTSDRRVLSPWERRGGVVRRLGLARVRLIVLGVVVLLFLMLIAVREREQAGVRRTRATLTQLRSSVDEYMSEQDGGCPQSLSQAVATAEQKEVPRDAWGRSFRFVCPSLREGHHYDLMSDGPDGKPGGLDRIE